MTIRNKLARMLDPNAFSLADEDRKTVTTLTQRLRISYASEEHRAKEMAQLMSTAATAANKVDALTILSRDLKDALKRALPYVKEAHAAATTALKKTKTTKAQIPRRLDLKQTELDLNAIQKALNPTKTDTTGSSALYGKNGEVLGKWERSFGPGGIVGTNTTNPKDSLPAPAVA
jgi:hypothetical protein